MRSRRFPTHSIFFPAIISIFLFASLSFGQQKTQPAGSIEKSERSEEFDRKAQEKLERMTPEEVEALDKKLAEALTLFYDRDYAKALPIFREISDRVETMDVMFWFGSAAAKAGESELARKKFRQMLEIDPNLHRVRLELATLYFGLGRFKEAKQELSTVLKAKPPKTVKNNIERLLAAIDAKTKKLYTNVRFSLGIQRDRNVSAGPDKEFINVPEGGTIGPLTNTQKELRDWVVVANFAGNALYEVGRKGGWMWNTTGSFYQTHNLRYPEFDFTQWRLTSGPWWTGKRSILKMPLGYAGNIYEHESLYKTLDFSPSYEYFFTRNFSLKGLYSYVWDNYRYSAIAVDDKTGQDNINRILEINPNFYFNNRNDILSFFLTDENVNAKERRWSYSAVSPAVSYFKHFGFLGRDMEFYTRFKYTKRDYDTPALLWPAGFLRTDKKYNFYAVLSRNFSKNWFASFSYNFINNESNTDLYDFDKYIYGFSVGVKF